MDTLNEVQRLFDRAKDEPVHDIDVVDRVRLAIRPLEIQPPAAGTIVWRVSAAVSALAAVIPLALVVKTYLVLNDFMIEFVLPAQEVWLW